MDAGKPCAWSKSVECIRRVGNRQQGDSMVQLLRAADRAPGRSRTVRFEGAEFGTDISFFSVDNDPGQGPGLHMHPYPETWIVKSGRARVVAGNEQFEVGPNDIAVVPAGVPHKFTNIGEDRLVMFCVHAAGTMVQDNLE
jgi:mannose-6-phosphate isomerase-like protein (cupin superfamily)